MSGHSKAPRVLIFGIDSGTFDYVDPLVAQGAMPNLARLMSRGVRAVMKSTEPYMTPAAWPSMVTGYHPDGHGVFGWFEQLALDYSLTPVSARNLAKRPFWHALSDRGWSVGVVNVPLTYPASPVNGFLIAGFDSPFAKPKWQSRICYPQHLWETIRSRHGEYRLVELFDDDEADPVLDPYFWVHSPSREVDWVRHFGNWASMEQQRTEVVLRLASEYQPNFVMVVHHIADYFGHRGTRDSEYVRRAYQVCDQCLGEMLKLCDEETTVFIVSDHGMNEIERIFCVHNWLESEGFMHFRDDLPEIQFSSVFADIFRFHEGAFDKKTRADLLSCLLDVRNSMTADERHAIGRALARRWPGYRIAHDNIDWPRTKIFTTAPYGLFYVNLVGIHRDGCVAPGAEYDALIDDFIARLNAIRDPYTRQPLVQRAYRGDRYYKRFKLGYCPDVIIEKSDHQCFIDPLYQHYLKTDKHFIRRSELDSRFSPAHFGYIGDHTPYGMLVAAGPKMRQGASVNMVDIVDIAPTILSLFDVPVPRDLDGRALKELFRGPVQVRETDDASIVEPVTTERLLEEEAELIRQTLRKLGYKL